VQKFIDVTIKPVLIIGGLGTAAAGLYGLFPRFAVENIAELEFIRDYTIFVQHWGFMVGLIGVFMVVAAFRESWRTPVLLYGLIEKAFMVFLVASNLGQPFASGFYAPAVMDALITVWLVLYFASLRQQT
jgi:hypothetical protein